LKIWFIQFKKRKGKAVRKSLLFLWLISFEFLASSQDGLFLTVFSGGGIDWPYGMILETEGELILAGCTSSYGLGRFDGFLIKLDKDMNPIWQKVFGTQRDERVVDLIKIGENYVVVGEMQCIEEGVRDIFISFFDSTGGMGASKRILGPDYELASKVFQISDGFVVVGSTKSWGAGDFDIFILRFDTLFNLQWARTAGGPNEEKGIGGTSLGNQTLVIHGYTNSFGSGNYDLLLVAFSYDGDFLWSRVVGGSDWDASFDICQTEEGFAITGFTYSFGAGWKDLFLSRFDSTGNQLSTTVVGGNLTDRGYSVLRISSGELFVFGITESFSVGSHDFMLTKFGKEGDFLWSKTVGGEETEYGFKIIDDGRRLLSIGTTGSFGYDLSDIAVLSFDYDGNSCLGETISPSFETVSFTVGVPPLSVESPSPSVEQFSFQEDYAHFENFFFCSSPCGDVNMDGDISPQDAILILLWIEGGGSLSSCFISNVNGDERISPADAICLLNWLAGEGELSCNSCNP